MLFREASLKLMHINRCNDHTEGVGDYDIKENYNYDDMTMRIIEGDSDNLNDDNFDDDERL